MLRLTVALLLGVLTHQALADEPEAIVGGTNADLGEFPYQCGMSRYGSHFCGCSILSATKILTAAHCVEDGVRPSEIVIRTGSLDNKSGRLHNVVSIVMHPNYLSGAKNAWVNDIAVITLAKPMQFSAYEYPVQLANIAPQSGTQCVLSGWGMTGIDKPGSKDLLKMNTWLVTKERCRQVFGPSISSTHVCALNRKGIGACMGDSGGPLVCSGQQVGVVSWSSPCANGVPDVYTDVYYHRNFIAQQMTR